MTSEGGPARGPAHFGVVHPNPNGDNGPRRFGQKGKMVRPHSYAGAYEVLALAVRRWSTMPANKASRMVIVLAYSSRVCIMPKMY